MKKRVVCLGLTLLLLLNAALVTALGNQGWYLVLRSADTGQTYGRYPMAEGDWFSVGFVHSVNKSPVIDCYQIKHHSIYVEKTIYYNFGAGVQTELEGNETLSYGEDGAMIVSGFDREMPDLTYFVGTVSDHTLIVNNGEEISLRNLCGRSSKVRFTYEWLWW